MPIFVFARTERVEAFYDAVLPRLGLSRKTESHVNMDGEWCDVAATHPRNVIEYHTPAEPGARGWFVGFIEDATMLPTKTRIARASHTLPPFGTAGVSPAARYLSFGEKARENKPCAERRPLRVPR